MREGWARVGEGWARVGEGLEGGRRLKEGGKGYGEGGRVLERGGRGLGEGWQRVEEGRERGGRGLARPRMVASCARRQARACFGPFPLRWGIVLRALQCVASVGGQGANTCDKCATDVGSLRCTWTHRRAAPAGPAWACEGVCVPSMRRCSASSSVRRCGPAGSSGQGHAATWEHCVHRLVPVGVAEDTVSHSPQRWQVCGRWEVGDQGSRRRSQRWSHRWRRGPQSSSRRARTLRR